MSETPRAASPFFVRLVLPLIAASSFYFACNGPAGRGTVDRQAEFDRLLASYDQAFVTYLARAQADMGREVLRYSAISEHHRLGRP